VDGPGGGRFESAEELAAAIEQKWPAESRSGQRFVVCTGGEPLLQLDASLIAALHASEFEIAVETNGTIAAPEGPDSLDWLCVSPKAGAKLVQRSGDELKLVYPQPGADPAEFELLSFRHFFLQPMDGPEREANTQLALRYCLGHPKWRLSLQTHKILGIP
jgi:7-carboxy-7-deazaguanine synthase (Cx14CxxC type)